MIDKKQSAINLESLVNLSAKLNESVEEKEILNDALLSLMGKLKITRGVALLPNESAEKFVPSVSKGKQNLSGLPFFEVKSLCKVEDSPRMKKLKKEGFEFCAPVSYQKKLFAIICLGKKLDSKELTDEEYHYVEIVTKITANALANAENFKLLQSEKKSLEKRNLLLTTLFEISRDFASLFSREEILRLLSYNLMGRLMINKFALIAAKENPKDERRYVELKNLFSKSVSLDFLESFSYLDEPAEVGGDLKLDSDATKKLSALGINVVSPVVVQGKKKGFLLIGKKATGGEFSSEDLQFIKLIGDTAFLALENERLFKEEIEKKRMESEMSFALEIQRNLLPKEAPQIDGFDISGDSLPSKTVGGDYYDFIKLPNGELLIAIADVSGKGMPAALLMANVQAALRVLAPLSLPLSELVSKINSVVYENTAADKFVTFFLGKLNVKKRAFSYVNAGHNPPIYIKSDGEVQTLNEGGLILGVLDNPGDYDSGEVKLTTGDALILYTDGVTEASDQNGEEYGEKRLVRKLLELREGVAKSIISDIIDEARRFSANEHRKDDITIAAIKAI